MRLMHRMGFQLRADAHGVMDRIEDRGLLMKQHLREAELELDHKRARIEALESEIRRLGEAMQREQAVIDRLDQDVELALKGGKQDLARFALRRLLPHRRGFEALAERHGEIVRDRDLRTRILAEQEQAFAQLRERVQGRLAALEAEWATSGCTAGEVADEEIELELLRRNRNLAGESTPRQEDA